MIFVGETNNIRGAFIASHNRIKNIVKLNEYEIDLYLIQNYKNIIIRLLTNKSKCIKTKEFNFDGLTYKSIWLYSSFTDYLLRKFNKKEILKNYQLRNKTKLFSEYDLLSVHSKEPGYLALMNFRLHKVPYTVTWHGSDIHTHPFSDKSVFEITKSILDNASMNFFVSNDLMIKSKQISENSKSVVVYNGIDRSLFYPFSDIQLSSAFEKFRISPANKNILFVGDFHYNKNIRCLPEVFSLIKQKIPNAELFIVGYEPEQNKVVPSIANNFIEFGVYANFFGQISNELMPALINCMSLCILPSFNEGMPLFVLEAIACGVSFVGSRVGGIPEVIGEENTVQHGKNFNKVFSELCITKLLLLPRVKLKPNFDWTYSSRIEYETYEGIFSNT